MNEAQTRLELIDPALKASGWGVADGSRIFAEHKITDGRLSGNGKRGTTLSADYVLRFNNRSLAVVEAKAKNIGYSEGVAQAKEYASRLRIRYTYATNGVDIYEIDMKLATEKLVDKFPTPDELWVRTFSEESNIRDELFKVAFEDRGGFWSPRYYQENAITAALDSLSAGKDRILLTLATGTGKTAISFQIAWKLFHSRWSLSGVGKRRPRILFLADRNILADQAFNSFNAFPEDALVRISPKEIKKAGRVQKNGSIFFTIFQSFMSGPDESPYFGEYEPNFFDFIIIDECHRGGAKDESSWRAILEHFSPAIQLGLTATPKRDINGDTYAYFGEPVYEYSLKEGINDGFLTPFRVKEIDTTIDEYMYTPDDDVESGDIEVGQQFEEKDFNRIIEIKEREEYRVKLFMDMIDQNHKTIVFCATQTHAAAVRDLINQYADSDNPLYCARVTANDGAMGEQYLKEFQDNERIIPTILTTSQKLSTGVDAREVRNIVLLRPVRSMVEFKQIVGRGTRLFDGKDYFTIFDFVEAHEHFQDPEWDGPPLEPVVKAPKLTKEDAEFVEDNAGEDDLPSYSDDFEDEAPKQMIKITLADNKVRELDSMMKTSFWDISGKPISSSQFLENLYGELPKIFKDENELREIWKLPSTRKQLLDELTEKGYSYAQLEDLRKLVRGENSDLFDVLSYVAYHKDLVPRSERAGRAVTYLHNYNKEQQSFLNFVLKQYVRDGITELDDAKLPDLLELKYNSISDAKGRLGSIADIRSTFINFQANLYKKAA